MIYKKSNYLPVKSICITGFYNSAPSNAHDVNNTRHCNIRRSTASYIVPHVKVQGSKYFFKYHINMGKELPREPLYIQEKSCILKYVRIFP